MRSPRSPVNARSPFSANLRHLLTIVGAVSVLAASTAHADRVVVLRASGDADTVRLGAIEEAVSAGVRALAHEVVSAPGGGGPPPQTAEDLRAVAQAQRAEWVIVPIVHDSSPDAYWVTLRVGFAPAVRVQELDAEVRRIRERPRLQELLQVLIRPEGLSEDGLALAGFDTVGRDEEQASGRDAEERARREAEEAAARAAEDAAVREAAQRAADAEREAREAEEAEAAAEAERLAGEAFAARDRYGVADGLWMVQAGLGLRPIARSVGEGGLLGTLELRGGRGFESLPGLELRAGVELVFGAASAFAVHIGGVYLASPFTTPIHLGASVEAGLFQAITGNRVPSFSGRVSAVVAWNPGGSIYLELSLPEVQYLSANGGVLALGVSARLGTRF